jgi:hypothetical protein
MKRAFDVRYFLLFSPIVLRRGKTELYLISGGTITASKAYHGMMNSSIIGYQPSISLLCDIMMYKDKDISSRPRINILM